MARVTVEDCVDKIPNRFELVMLAAQRARNIGAGAALTLDRDNDRNPVVALREIADETVSLNDLEDNLIQSLQKVVEFDEPPEDEVDILAIQRELGGELTEPVEPRASEEVAMDDLHVEDENEEEVPLEGEFVTPTGEADLGPEEKEE